MNGVGILEITFCSKRRGGGVHPCIWCFECGLGTCLHLYYGLLLEIVFFTKIKRYSFVRLHHSKTIKRDEFTNKFTKFKIIAYNYKMPKNNMIKLE